MIYKIKKIFMLVLCLILIFGVVLHKTISQTKEQQQELIEVTEPIEEVKLEEITKPIVEETELETETEEIELAVEPTTTMRQAETEAPETTTIEIETETVEIPVETETEVIIEESTPTYLYSLSETDLDIIANVIKHEVGDLYGPGSNITITYADGRVETYTDSCIIHYYHAKAVINMYNSSLFPSTVSQCVYRYWATYLSNANYYNKNNTTWQHCRQDAIQVATYGCSLPDNVFGATQDPNFASKYPMYRKYATVQWSTQWISGTFYYYEYIG